MKIKKIEIFMAILERKYFNNLKLELETNGIFQKL